MRALAQEPPPGQDVPKPDGPAVTHPMKTFLAVSAALAAGFGSGTAPASLPVFPSIELPGIKMGLIESSTAASARPLLQDVGPGAPRWGPSRRASPWLRIGPLKVTAVRRGPSGESVDPAFVHDPQFNGDPRILLKAPERLDPVFVQPPPSSSP